MFPLYLEMCSNVLYSGLGDTNYTNFCNGGKELEKRYNRVAL